MKLFIILAFSLFPVFASAQKKDKLYIGFQVQPELTFYKSQYPFVSPTTYAKSSFNIGFNLYGQYQLTDRLYTTLGVGFISRKLNTRVGIDESTLPAPYTDSFGTGWYQITKVISYRLLQIPIGFGYNFLKTKKTNVFASIAFIPNFLYNTKYGGSIQYPSPGAGDPYPAFRKNYWQGFSLNPGLGLDYALSGKIKLTGALAYSIVNTVKEEEYGSKQPKLKHTYLQLSLGAKYKLK
jgi:opacity protein-like surface antigen